MIKLVDIIKEDKTIEDADRWVAFLKSKLDLDNLKKEFGANYNKRIEQAKKLATETFSKELLNDTILKDGSRLGDNPEVIKAFSMLADKLSEDEIIKGDGLGYMTANDYVQTMNDAFQLIFIKDNRFMLCSHAAEIQRKLTYNDIMSLKKVDVDNCNVDKLVSGGEVDVSVGPFKTPDTTEKIIFDDHFKPKSNRVSTVNRDLEGQMQGKINSTIKKRAT